ncbi:hypothetical protein HBI94_090400 [Parastagonospora nodorum]|nr:hypothetical protein HBI94_090400 [Parastagonospora nodorum]
MFAMYLDCAKVAGKAVEDRERGNGGYGRSRAGPVLRVSVAREPQWVGMLAALFPGLDQRLNVLDSVSM